jgi:monoterpene epsilon-lactone hydrolase
MASLLARVIGAVLRTTGTLRKRYSDSPDFMDRIAASRANPDLPTAKMRKRLAVSETMLNGRSIWKIAPKDGAPSAYLLYFHGGGYVYPAVDVHWKFMAHMAEKYRISVTAPLYPLAPEASAEETTAFGLAAYKAFLASHDGPFIMGGDSAGGGLTAVVAMAARDKGLRQASGLLLVCPWLDGSGAHPDQPAIEKRDCVLTLGGIRAAAKLYARDLPISDPRVSPIHGDWSKLPPILCYGGGDDILVTDARALKAKLPAIEYVELAGLMHVWPIFFLRESRAAQAQIAEFAVRVSQS